MVTHIKYDINQELDMLRRESDIKLDPMHPEVHKFIRGLENMHAEHSNSKEVLILKPNLELRENVTWIGTESVNHLLPNTTYIIDGLENVDYSDFLTEEQKLAKMLGINIGEEKLCMITCRLSNKNIITVSADGLYTLHEIININNTTDNSALSNISNSLV